MRKSKQYKKTGEEHIFNNAYRSGKESVVSKSLFLQNHLTLAQTFKKKTDIGQAQKTNKGWGGNATNFPLWTFLTQFFNSTMPITVSVQCFMISKNHGFCVWHNCHPFGNHVSTGRPGLTEPTCLPQRSCEMLLYHLGQCSPQWSLCRPGRRSAQPIPYVHVIITVLKALCMTVIFLNLWGLGGWEVGSMIGTSGKEPTHAQPYI